MPQDNLLTPEEVSNLKIQEDKGIPTEDTLLGEDIEALVAQEKASRKSIIGEPSTMKPADIERIEETLGPVFDPSQQDIEQDLAEQQSGGEQFLNSTIGGIAKGGLTAIQDLSYIADIPNAVGTLFGYEQVEDNAISEWAQRQKQALDEALPVYKRNPQKAFDLSDSGWWASVWSSVLDSAVGFGVTGGVVGKSIGSLGKAAKIAKVLGTTGANIATRVPTALLTNYGEGKYMGIELFKNVVDKGLKEWESTQGVQLKNQHTALMEREINNLGLPPLPINYENPADFQAAQEAYKNQVDLIQNKHANHLQQAKDDFELKLREEAGKKARGFMAVNTINTLQNYFALRGMFKGLGGLNRTRQLPAIQRAFSKDHAGELWRNVGINAVSEYAEEVGQGVAQKEAEYRALEAAGVEDKKLPTNTIERLGEFFADPNTQLEGVMGLISGPLQSAAVTTFGEASYISPGRRAEAREAYEAQQANIQANKDFVINNFEKEFARQQEKEAILLDANLTQEAKESLIDQIDQDSLKNVTFEAARNGTADSIEESLNEIKGYSKEEAAEKGYEENYIEKAESLLDTYKGFKKSYARIIDRQLPKLNSWIENQEGLEDAEKEVIRHAYTKRLYDLETTRVIADKTIEKASPKIEERITELKAILEKSDENPINVELEQLNSQVKALDTARRDLERTKAATISILSENKDLAKDTRPEDSPAVKALNKEISGVEAEKIAIIKKVNSINKAVEISENSQEKKITLLKELDGLNIKKKALIKEKNKADRDLIWKTIDLEDFQKRLDNLKTHKKATKAATSSKIKELNNKKKIAHKAVNALETQIKAVEEKQMEVIDKEHTETKAALEANAILKPIRESYNEEIQEIDALNSQIESAKATYKVTNEAITNFKSPEGMSEIAKNFSTALNQNKERVKKAAEETRQKVQSDNTVITIDELGSDVNSVRVKFKDKTRPDEVYDVKVVNGNKRFYKPGQKVPQPVDPNEIATYTPLDKKEKVDSKLTKENASRSKSTTSTTTRKIRPSKTDKKSKPSTPKVGQVVSPDEDIESLTDTQVKSKIKTLKSTKGGEAIERNLKKIEEELASEFGVTTEELAEPTISASKIGIQVPTVKQGPTTEQIDKMKAAVAKATPESLFKLLDEFFAESGMLNEADYSKWQDGLDSKAIEKELKPILEKAQPTDDMEVGYAVTKYLLPKYLDSLKAQDTTVPLSTARKQLRMEAGKELLRRIQQINKTNKQGTANNSVQTDHNDIPPANSDEKIPQSDIDGADVKDSNKNRTAQKVAWKDLNTTRGADPIVIPKLEKMRKLLTEFLDNPDESGKLEEVEVEYVIGTEVIDELLLGEESVKRPEYKLLTPKFKPLRHNLEKRNAKFDGDIANLPVKLLFYKNGEPLIFKEEHLFSYLHDGDFFDEGMSEEQNKKFYEDIVTLKTKIYNDWLNDKVGRSKVQGKSGGIIHQGDSKGLVTERLEAEDLTIVSGDKSGHYTIRNADGNIEISEELSQYDGASPGASYVVVKTANGRNFPLKVDKRRVNREAAEILYESFRLVANPKTSEVQFKTKVKDIPELSNILKASRMEIPVSDTTTVSDLINTFVYTGDKDSLSKASLQLRNGKLQIGDDRSNNFELNVENKENIIQTLMEEKLFNVTSRMLNNPAYKKFVFDNVLETTATLTPEGNLFVQPTIYVDSYDNVEFVQVEELQKAPVKKPVSPFGRPAVLTDAELKTGAQESKSDQEEFEKVYPSPNKPEDFVNPDDIEIDEDEAVFRYMADVPGKYKQESLEEFETWLNQTLPSIPVESRKRIKKVTEKGPDAQGAFVDGMIILNERAEEGTGFHEAFEAVWETYLSDKEQQALITEIKDSPNYKDRTQWARDNYTFDNEVGYIRETLAEEFRNKMLEIKQAESNKEPVTWIGRIEKFFKELWTLIKDLFSNPSKVDRIFNRINKGYYANKPTTRVTSTTPRYREVKGFTPDEVAQTVEFLAAALLHSSQKKQIDLRNVKDLDIDDLITPLLAQYKKAYKDWQADKENEPKKLTVTNFNRVIQELFLDVDTRKVNYKSSLIGALNEYLNKFGISTRAEEIGELNEEEVKSTLNIKPKYLVSSKDTASANTKLFVGILPKLLDTEMVNGSYNYQRGSFLNLPRFHNFGPTWNFLSANLAGITSTLGEDGKYTDPLETMMEKLSELSNFKPEMRVLYDKLKVLGEYKQTQFHNAFSQVKLNHSQTTVQKVKGKLTYKHSEGAQNSPEDTLRRSWQEKFKSSILNNEGEVKKEKVRDILNQYKKVKKAIAGAKEYKQESRYEELVGNLTDIYNQVGIDLSSKTIGYAIYELQQDKGGSKIASLNEFVRKNDYFFTSASGNTLNSLLSKPYHVEEKDGTITENSPIIDNESILNLARQDSYFKEDLQEVTTLDAEGNKRYVFSADDYMSKTISRVQAGDLSHIQALKATPYYQHSVWADKFIEDPKARESFKVLLMAGYKNLDSESDGSTYTDIKPADSITTRLNRVLQVNVKGQPNPIYPLLNPADKSRYKEVKGDLGFLGQEEFDITFVEEAPKITISNKVADRFAGYLADELLAMREAWYAVYGENPLPEHKRIENYHTKKGKPGNAFQLYLFPGFNPGGELAKRLHLYETGKKNKPHLLNEAYADFSGNLTPEFMEKVRPAIKGILAGIIGQEYKNLQQYEIFGDKGNKTLDTNVYEAYKQATVEGTNRMITAVATINTMAAGVEYAKLFTGDPRFYKDYKDYPKRVPASFAAGKNLRIFESDVAYDPEGSEEDRTYAVRPNYYQVTISNIEIPSSSLAQIRAGLEKVEGLKKSEIAEIVASYSKVNQTDAQAWITPRRFREISRGLGMWSDKLENYYQKNIIEGTPMTAEELKGWYKEIADIHQTFEPLKGVHFGVQDTGVPVYLKYSQATLLPALTRNTPLDALREAMERDKVDEAVVLDGNKVGSQQTTDIDIDGELVTADLIDLKASRRQLSNLDWKLQQELPSHGISDRLVGSQIEKNIYAVIDRTGNYNVFGEAAPISGETLVRELNKTVRELSARGLDNLHKELQYDGVQLDENVLRDILIKRITQRGNYDTTLVDALRAGFPIEALPGYRELLQNMNHSMVTDNVVKLKQPGGAFIQLSNFGISQTGEARAEDFREDVTKQIIWLRDMTDSKGELKPPLVNAEGRIDPGQILLPYSYLEKIPNWQERLVNKTLAAAFDKEALEIIGYRIPNQGTASSDYLEVVGILPPETGDTIVSYAEITTKTGSDFDIDKMFIITPNVRWNGERLEYIKFLTDPEAAYKEYADRALKSKEARKILKDAGFSKEEIRTADNLAQALTKADTVAPILKEYLGTSVAEEVIKIMEEDTSILSKEEFMKLDVYKQNSLEAVQNRRLDLYKAIMGDIKTYPYLMKSIDNPWLKEHAKTLREKAKIPESTQGLGWFSLTSQVNEKRKMLGGQAGIGQVANHMVQHNLLLHAKDKEGKPVRLTSYLGLGNQTDGVTVFNEKYVAGSEETGNPWLIADAITAYANAFVDIAKDPYIFFINNNTITTPMVMMLLRAGVDPYWINAFMSQPIIKDLVNTTLLYQSESIETPRHKNGGGKTMTPAEIVEQKLGIDTTDKSTLDFEKATRSMLEKQIEDAADGIRDLKTQAQVLNTFKEWLEISKDFNKLVSLMKVDVSGPGKNMLDTRAIENLRRELQDSEYLKGLEAIFNDSKADGTITEKYYDNAVTKTLDLYKNIYLTETQEFQSLLTHVMQENNRKSLTNRSDVDVANNLYKEWFGFLNTASLSQLPFSQEQLPSKLYGDNSVAKRLLKYQTDERSPIKDNLVVQILSPKLGWKKGNHPDLIIKNNFKVMDSITRDDIIRDFEALLSNKETEDFAEDLIKMAFMTSGFVPSGSSFYDIIPPKYLTKIEYPDFVKLLFREANGANPDSSARFLDQFYRHKWEDNKIVPKINKSRAVPFKTGNKTHAVTIDVEQGDNLVIGTNDLEEQEMRRFIKISYENKDVLYKLEGYTTVTKKDGTNVRAGVYIATHKLGYNRAGRKFKEYNYDTDIKNSIFVQNRTNLSNSDRAALIEAIPSPGYLPITGATTDLWADLSEDKQKLQEDVVQPNKDKEALGEELAKACKNKKKIGR